MLRVILWGAWVNCHFMGSYEVIIGCRVYCYCMISYRVRMVFDFLFGNCIDNVSLLFKFVSAYLYVVIDYKLDLLFHDIVHMILTLQVSCDG